MTTDKTISGEAIVRAGHAFCEIEAEIAALIREVVELNSRPDAGGAQRDELILGYRDRFMQLLRRRKAVEAKLLAGDDAPHLCEID